MTIGERRDQFEVWAAEHGLILDRDLNDRYTDSATRAAWDAWQEAMNRGSYDAQ